MELNNRDKSILTHIVQHCENIFSSMKRFGDSVIFAKDADYFNSVCMSLLQIGELANHLSAEFQAGHDGVPWRNIIGLRNVVVHGYGHLDIDTVWGTLQEDIPSLYQYCHKILDAANNQPGEK
ncbi:antitoxin [Spirochaetia bacterium]|nr:antitoxin [Spirochaetia bacterium]